MNNKELANIIDHTLLKADATQAEIIKLCAEAKEFNFASVCVNPSMVKLASEELKGCDVDVCTVIGFPLGATTSEVKAFEVKNTIENGATEVDMVINIGALKDKNYNKKIVNIIIIVDIALIFMGIYFKIKSVAWAVIFNICVLFMFIIQKLIEILNLSVKEER